MVIYLGAVFTRKLLAVCIELHLYMHATCWLPEWATFCQLGYFLKLLAVKTPALATIGAVRISGACNDLGLRHLKTRIMATFHVLVATFRQTFRQPCRL